MKSALLTFRDDKARDRFFKLLHETGEKLVGNPGTGPDGALITETLRTIKLDPPIRAEHERVVALFVSGQKIVEGTMTSMKQRFMQEVDSHSASVELKELRDGQWAVIQSRRHQRV